MSNEELRQAWDRMEQARSRGNNDGAMRDAKDTARILAESMTEFEGREFEGSNPNGTITVKVDGKGKIKQVYISPHAIRDLRAEGLGPECMVAISDARVSMSEQLREHLDQINGSLPTAPGMLMQEAAANPPKSPRELAAALRKTMGPLL